MKKYNKTSKTCIRVLETLKILAQRDASIQDIIRHFEKTDPNNRIYTNEVVLKYINTLKVFGFRFTKKKDKYILLNYPVQFNLNEEDLHAIHLIERVTDFFPEENIKSEIFKTLQDLERRFSDNTRVIAHNMRKPDFLNLKVNYNKYLKQINEYEKYCNDKQRLKIIYKNQTQTTSSVIVEPKEIKYSENEIYFSVYNPASAEVQDINFNSIIKIEQLPLKSTSSNMLSSVSFILKSRLAKSYRLHEGEELIKLESDGSIVVSSRKEDRILLLKRLLRYGDYCEVITPKSMREDMKQLIKTTLSNYR